MRAPIFQVDAFTTRCFAGNPAAVMPLQSFPADAVMLAIAAENNLSETAFLVPEDDGYQLRWFTPAAEVPLCGHATLASAAVVMEKLQPGRDQVVFHSASGRLVANRTRNGYMLDFPARPSHPAVPPRHLVDALGVTPQEVFHDDFNYLALVESLEVLRGLAPDMQAIARMNGPDLIVTAPGNGQYDFYSRYFAPSIGISEDPVTGSAHCMLAPYWARKLGKNELRAFQAAQRGGEVVCRVIRDRVELEGSCVFYMQGEVEFEV
jgi:PhzF family phenazine biosynthesis protein